MRIAINGMGRIGRLLFRRLMSDDNFQVVAVNDIMDPVNVAYLLKYDSLYGTNNDDVSHRDGFIETKGKSNSFWCSHLIVGFLNFQFSKPETCSFNGFYSFTFPDNSITNSQ